MFRKATKSRSARGRAALEYVVIVAALALLAGFVSKLVGDNTSRVFAAVGSVSSSPGSLPRTGFETPRPTPHPLNPDLNPTQAPTPPPKLTKELGKSGEGFSPF